MVEKELDIRKRILRDYNKKVLWIAIIQFVGLTLIFNPQEEDFGSLEEYNDFLEEIETIIYNLCNDIDQLETNKKIEAYKKENRDVILKNKIRISKEEYELDILLEQEKEQVELRKKELLSLEVDAKKKKTIKKEALIDELMFSQDNAADIIKTFAKNAEEEKEKIEQMPPTLQRSTNFSTGIRFGSGFQQQFLPVPKNDEGPLYVYQELFFDNQGPTVPPMQKLEQLNYTKHIRNETLTEKAGGFLTKMSCQRAIQEAMQGLYHGF